ncbi:MAG TPA: GDSL-type esterase/lipase family protein [Chitinophagaceae bacterium]|nr:GDSL-type esterase/lipase family protein [Chitinophagaceae bacterium]
MKILYNCIKCFCLLLLLVIADTTIAQQPPFYEEIQQFKHEDSLNPPPQHAILFAGSSSFRLWSDVQNYFPNHTIINRGFGGSSLTDVIRYANDIIFPYHPKQIVIYCGENDLAASDTVSAAKVVSRFVQLFTLIRSRLEKVPVLYISIKPSPSRMYLAAKMQEANKQIQLFLQQQKKAQFADVYHSMLGADDKPIPTIYKEDSLHMNASGYAIWQKIIEPYLVK